MDLKRSKTIVDCVPMSFAMCLDISVEKIYDFCGHRGLDVINPGQPEPFCYKGFHVAEIIPLCWNLGFKVVQFSLQNYLISGNDELVLAMSIQKAEQYLYRAMNDSNGVILGHMNYTHAPHAVAWDYNFREILDPSGLKYDTSCHKIKIDSFYAVTK